MKKVGLYFGSFNPIHNGHLGIANYFANSGELDEVWLVVSPHNPLKENKTLAPDRHRLEMANLAVEGHPNIKVCDIEFDLPRPSYTIETMKSLESFWPDYQFTIIMGEDSLRSLHLWKNYRELIESYSICVFPRHKKIGEASVPVLDDAHKDIRIVDAPLIEVSSTEIRDRVKNQLEINYLTVNQVVRYISDHHLYQ
ncbi:MAG: nicotinate (nicotinamide) nucleotide adenylyltransferase [Flavobacteriales bacterium]